MPASGGRQGLPGDDGPHTSGSIEGLEELTPDSTPSSGPDASTSEATSGPPTLAESRPPSDGVATESAPDSAGGRGRAAHPDPSSPTTQPAPEPSSTSPLDRRDMQTIDWTPRIDASETGDVRLVGPSGSDDDPPCDPRRFRVEGSPKQGGIGRVWRVRDRRLGRFIALKDLRPDRRDSRRMVRRFLREAQVTAQLEHPGIVPVHELEKTADGQPFYLMKFVEGQTLREAAHDFHLARGKGRPSPLDLRDLVQAVLFVARTLAYAHARGVIHRDLKPQNIILGAYGEVFLLDWGLAGLREQPQSGPPEADSEPRDEASADSHPIELDPDSNDATEADDVLGTLPYMPPEQAEGGRDGVDRRSDVFGLGAILYSVLTDRSPLQGANNREGYWRIWREGIPSPRKIAPETPRALEAICLKALEGDPSRRYESASAFADDLKRWLADEPVSAHAESWPTRAMRWAKHHKTLVVGASALLITAVITLSISLIFIDNARREARRAELETSKTVVEIRRALREVENSWVDLRGALKDLEKISDSQLAHIPGLTEVRRNLAETALGYLTKAAQRRPDDAEIHRLTVEALRELAMHERIGRRLREASGRYATALAQMDRFRKQTGQYDLHHAGLLNYDLGIVLSMLGRPDEALGKNELVIKAGEELSKQIPNSSRGPRLKALGLSQKGKNLHLLGRGGDAVSAFRESLELWDPLAKAVEGESDQDRVLRAVYLPAFGLALRDAGHPDEADRILEQATADIRAQIEKEPKNNDLQMILNSALVDHARVLLSLGRERLDDAETMASEAQALATGLRGQYPEFPNYREREAVAHDLVGDIHHERGRLAEADAEHSQSRAILDELVAAHPDDTSFNGLLADVLLDLAAPTADGRAQQDPAAARALVEEAGRRLEIATKSNDRDPDDRRNAERVDRYRKALRTSP